MNLKQICGIKGKREFALDMDNNLYFRENGEWTPYDFNRLYEGYYPTIAFSLIAYEGGFYYLAGNDPDGRPHLYASLAGGVWEEKNLNMKDPLYGLVPAEGKILFLLYDEKRSQLFLITDSRQLITLPDCPHCVLIRDLDRADILDASLKDERILIQYRSGETEQIPVEMVSQYKISLLYAKEKFADEMLFVDLGSNLSPAGTEEFKKIKLDLEDLPEWLKKKDKKTVILFYCQNGYRADRAVKYARNHGYDNTYTLGGVDA